jgi:hypothetical protein
MKEGKPNYWQGGDMVSLVVPHRFRGPARSGNGGWTAGSYAELLAPGTVEVTLKQPPPLDVPIEVTVVDGTASSEVAVARLVDKELVTVAPVPADVARAAESSYAGLVDHPFAECFTCGTGRAAGDGLRIFAGHVSSDVVAATWTPDESLAGDAGPAARASYAVTWAALDCPSGWAYIAEGRPAVLGRMTARVDALPRIGAEHVVVGRFLEQQGRKVFTASTLYDDSGQAIATAEQVWIEVDPTAFN